MRFPCLLLETQVLIAKCLPPILIYTAVEDLFDLSFHVPIVYFDCKGCGDMVRVAVAIFLLALMACVSQAQEGARLALLIGNQGYAAKVGRLKNPHNDVTLIETSLKRLGFKVTVLRDANYKAMDISLKRYVTEVRRAGPNALSFFYYSGHGVASPETQINYLIPVDVVDTDDDKIWFESFQQTTIIDLLSKHAPNATRYVVFDACRNELNIAGTVAKGLGTDKGFVPITDTAGLLTPMRRRHAKRRRTWATTVVHMPRSWLRNS